MPPVVTVFVAQLKSKGPARLSFARPLPVALGLYPEITKTALAHIRRIMEAGALRAMLDEVMTAAHFLQPAARLVDPSSTGATLRSAATRSATSPCLVASSCRRRSRSTVRLRSRASAGSLAAAAASAPPESARLVGHHRALEMAGAILARLGRTGERDDVADVRPQSLAQCASPNAGSPAIGQMAGFPCWSVRLER